MPENPEIRIMCDFVNEVSENKVFINGFHVEKGNKPSPLSISELPFEKFKIKSDFNGKKLIIYLYDDKIKIPIYIFMGMSGSVKLVDTPTWYETKFTRLRFDSKDGKSLLLYGGYKGPKYSFFRNFATSKDGYDIIKQFDSFCDKIHKSIDDKIFETPIFELLLDQRYFCGIGNYLRSTILYHANINPFQSAKKVIKENPNFMTICKNILEEAYEKNGGQLKDWKNPFQVDSTEFDNWVFYQKGESIKDSTGRTFWFDIKWK